MSEKIKTHEMNNNLRNVAVATMASLALAGSIETAKGSVAEAAHSEGVTVSSELRESHTRIAANIRQARENAKRTPEKTQFQRIMNNRVRNTVVKLASNLDKGPSKPSTLLESWVGPNRLNTISYGSPDKSGRQYTVTTMAPVLPSGKSNVKKTWFLEVNAGDTRLTFSQDPISKDWSVDGAYAPKPDGEPNLIRAAVNPVAPGDSPLGPAKLTSFRAQFNRVLTDGQNLAPFVEYKPAFPQPTGNPVPPFGY